MKTLAAVIEEYFERRDMACEKHERANGDVNRTVLLFGIDDPRAGVWRTMVDVQEGSREVTVTSLPEVRPNIPLICPQESLAALALLLAHTNYDLKHSGWGLDLETRMVSYRDTFVVGNGELTEEQFAHLIENSSDIMEDLLPMIWAVVGGVLPPEKVLRLCGATEDGSAPAVGEFDVILTNAGGTKISVMVQVRRLTGLSLKDVKALVESAPQTVLERVSKEAAEEAKQRLRGAGASVKLKRSRESARAELKTELKKAGLLESPSRTIH